jgi:putative endonuclease
MYYVYVLRSLNANRFYIGYTNDLKRRVREHFRGESLATKGFLPFELVYYEMHKNGRDALAREKFLKTGWGRSYIKKILSNYLRERA